MSSGPFSFKNKSTIRLSVTYVIVFGEESTTVPKCMGGFVVSPYTQRPSILALGVFGFCNCDDLVVSQKYRGMLGTEIENISLDFCCNKKATRAADIGRNYVGLYCKNFHQKLGRLPLPLEGYLDNTYFRTTTPILIISAFFRELFFSSARARAPHLQSALSQITQPPPIMIP